MNNLSSISVSIFTPQAASYKLRENDTIILPRNRAIQSPVQSTCSPLSCGQMKINNQRLDSPLQFTLIECLLACWSAVSGIRYQVSVIKIFI